MDRNVTLILLIAVLAFFAFSYCPQRDQKQKGRQEVKHREAPRHPELPKAYPVGKALAAKKQYDSLPFRSEKKLIKLDLAEPGEPGFHAIFDPRGGALRQLYLTDFSRKVGQDLEDPENWIPLIDFEVFDAGKNRAGRLQGDYQFSFLWQDPHGKLNLFRKVGDEEEKIDPEEIVWHHQLAPDRRGVLFSLPLSTGLTLTKEYTFPRGARHFELKLGLSNRSYDLGGQTLNWSMTLTGPAAVPAESYIQGPDLSIRDFYGAVRAIAVAAERQTEGGAQGEPQEPILVMADGKPNPQEVPTLLSVASGAGEVIRFAGSFHKFFACLTSPLDPSTQNALTDVSYRKVPGGRFKPIRHGVDFYNHIIPSLGLLVRVPEKGGEMILSFQVYAGPKDVTLFKEVEAYRDYVAVYRSDLENIPCFCSVPLVGTFGRLLLSLLRFFYSIAGNWGIATIMLTVLVRLILVPFNYKSQFEMARYQKRMGKVKPLMDAIRKRYQKNRQKMNQELMKLQKEHKLTPPLMGCLPMFITIPVFLGLFTALRVSFDLRQQPFFGWIRDLSMPDMLMRLQSGATGWVDTLVPDYLNVLPLLMTLLWFVQQRLMPRSDDPQQKQMQTMMQFMPIMFGFFLYNYAAGLALYMTVSSFFGILEARIIRRRVKALTDAPPAAPQAT